MSSFEVEEHVPPKGHVKLVYLGPVAPHWEVRSDFGDKALIEEFRQRALARLLLLTKADPQFRRNSERISRDAQREHLNLEWDMGDEVFVDPLTVASSGSRTSNSNTSNTVAPTASGDAAQSTSGDAAPYISASGETAPYNSTSEPLTIEDDDVSPSDPEAPNISAVAANTSDS